MSTPDVEMGRTEREGPPRFIRFLAAFLWPCHASRSSETTAERTGDTSSARSSGVGGGAPDEPKSPAGEKTYTETESAEACSKLWSIYVSEAERYDKLLVERWKDDMSGMLIFSGLYSASLVAFLIESYKTLQPDSGDITVALLSQLIAIQLAAASGGVPDPLPSDAPFRPTTASLVCNIFWFLSLALSLTCALLATLVEQWARDFLHKTEMRPSPVQRAKVFSFLYFGLKKFGMHAAVDAIPMILHASLFFFFAGLVAFLLPVNDILMYLMAGITVVFLFIYALITILPILFLDCPYHTPLSGVFWRLWSAVRPIFPSRVSSSLLRTDHASMTSAMMVVSTENTRERDEHAITWTVESLTDDTELLPFLEAIPDAIHGPKGFHHVNDHLFIPVIAPVGDQLPLGTRLFNLLRSSSNLSIGDVLRTRRQNGSLKAIWALAITSRHSNSLSVAQSIYWFSQMSLRPFDMPTLDKYWTISARTAVRYSQAICVGHFVDGLEDFLRECEKSGDIDDVHDMQTMLADSLSREHDIFDLQWLLDVLSEYASASEVPLEERVTILPLPVSHFRRTEQMCTNQLVSTLADYLSASFQCGSCPYEFSSTCEVILSAIPRQSWGNPINHNYELHQLFRQDVVDPVATTSNAMMTSDPIQDIDTVMKFSLLLLSLVSPHFHPSTLYPIYRYIANRKSTKAISYLLSSCDMTYVHSCIIKDLQWNSDKPDSRLPALWVLLTLSESKARAGLC